MFQETSFTFTENFNFLNNLLRILHPESKKGSSGRLQIIQGKRKSERERERERER